MIVASDINQRGISTSDTAHTAHNSLLRKLNDFQSAICLVSGRLPPDSLLKNLIRNQTCEVAVVLQREQLWGFSLYFQKLVLFHESTLISPSYPYFLEAANEHFSCREQFILPPLGAWSKPSSGPSGSFFPVLAELWQFVCSHCCEHLELCNWTNFLAAVSGWSGAMQCLWRKQLYLCSAPHQPFISSKHNGTTPDAGRCALAPARLLAGLALNPSDEEDVPFLTNSLGVCSAFPERSAFQIFKYLHTWQRHFLCYGCPENLSAAHLPRFVNRCFNCVCVEINSSLLLIMSPQPPSPQLLIWIELEDGFIAEYSLDIGGK